MSKHTSISQEAHDNFIYDRNFEIKRAKIVPFGLNIGNNPQKIVPFGPNFDNDPGKSVPFGRKIDNNP
ncbi:MAG: hypothetical protein GTO45_33130 [Candidatus Aminicenantes bacterium]|nr:hypothetical protein [Candidatus Aminicenantes bacterium]NIN22985.1 hypothetical protein [Candidatus Aminicenantes bacterium]NIN46722.1 hypothetical protein [Candidatus Aminicenantes bacterium]NIN89628.1 hypothetical protein [Candidatus Aminicenantes bacterium]NIO86176.1 hypothetical protein [Candidatus Aminicenantes bacterium]